VHLPSSVFFSRRRGASTRRQFPARKKFRLKLGERDAGEEGRKRSRACARKPRRSRKSAIVRPRSGREWECGRADASVGYFENSPKSLEIPELDFRVFARYRLRRNDSVLDSNRNAAKLEHQISRHCNRDGATIDHFALQGCVREDAIRAIAIVLSLSVIGCKRNDRTIAVAQIAS